jgi:hypothetical protein
MARRQITVHWAVSVITFSVGFLYVLNLSSGKQTSNVESDGIVGAEQNLATSDLLAGKQASLWFKVHARNSKGIAKAPKFTHLKSVKLPWYSLKSVSQHRISLTLYR